MNLEITKLGHTEKAPMDLLFKADPSVEMIERYLYSGDCYLAKLDGQLAGAFVLMPNNDSEIELKNISIDAQYQGQGIGKEIIKYVVRISKMEGYEYLVVKTADSSKDTIEYYQKLKFEHYFISKGHFLKYYDQPIIENGQQAIDQIALRRKL
ncbi:GNAT family N-acetyltransferase [Marinoscillum furvescens]|uniref:Ribosomal protein S18 acetylase RimI-like enzyme n=1 Tax=Marinoscillum furvescens DSM 4134 TaxID=1122208 RepID=A0A3D9KWK9_MARFU|nr:GNAT family N-acetyltransferase [Marinoscillum furvescens]RED92663.1 ribosomal protein S18 acetylase RimI-like enzyme [Marinoscillum furvescens DSM 4134]